MDLIFIISALGVISAATMVISSFSPVHSVFWLVIAFVSSVVLFISLNLEYIALLFLIVYVGAIAMLFLFVMMMLYSAMEGVSLKMYEYLPLSFMMGIVALLKVMDTFSNGAINYSSINSDSWTITSSCTNMESISRVLYTDYGYAFMVTSIILLTALMGAIVLTHTSTHDIKSQVPFKQIASQTY